MEEFSEELYLFDNTIQLFLVQILYRRTKDSRFSHNSTSWVVEELCRRSVNRNELSWEYYQHEYYQIIYIEKVRGGNGGLSTEVGNETPFSTSCDKREWRVQRGEEHNSSAK